LLHQVGVFIYFNTLINSSEGMRSKFTSTFVMHSLRVDCQTLWLWQLQLAPGGLWTLSTVSYTTDT